MQGDTFKIAVISDDSLFLKELKNQLRRQFPTLVCDLTLQENARTTIQSLKRDLYDLVVAVEKNLDCTLDELERDIQRISGSTAILMLGIKNQSNQSQVLNWPMTEWGTFLDRIFEMIPEEMKQKAALKRKDTALFDELQKYSQQYVVPNVFPQNSSIALIPQLFEGAPAQSGQSFGTGEMVESSEIIAKGEIAAPKNWVFFEAAFVFGLFVVSAICYRLEDNKWIFYIFLVTANLGLLSLLLSRFLNPLMKKGQ